MDDLPEDMTELYDADVPRADLVGKGANGVPGFLVMKQDAAGLLDADYVRELIGKSEPEPTAEPAGETVTMTGSPAAIAKMIHQAAQRAERQSVPVHLEVGGSVVSQRDLERSIQEAVLRANGRPTYEQVVKAKYNADDRKRLAGTGAAMAGGGYPIADKDDLDNAIRAVGRGGADHDAIRRHVAARAKALGASSEIPDNWNADGSLNDGAVSKEMETTDVPETAEVTKDLALDDGADGMDPTVILAAPDSDDAPGDPMDPGSPAWEAVDAATAQKWTSILARAKAAVDMLAQREMLEAASVDPSDEENAWDLQDACCAIDFAISVLAPFAVAEQSEADCGADMMAAVGKALATFDTAPLDTLEAFAQVRKAGRVLSSANEAAIRGAVESLQKVLASLPQAPQVPDDGQQVAKEEEKTTMADNDTQAANTDVPATTPDATTHMGTAKTPAGEVPAARDVAKAEQNATAATPAPVAKADKVAQVAIYDADGNLVGTVDPADVTPLANAKAPASPSSDGDKGDGDGAMAAAPDAAPAAPPADLTPAPAATVGTPADAVPDDDVNKTTGPTEPTNEVQDVFKSIADSAIRAALDDYSASQEQVIAKQAEMLTQQAEVIKGLEDRLEKVENQPAISAVFGNGAVPPAHMLRGQNTGAPVDMTEAQMLRKQLAESDDAIEKKRIADRMQELAIARFQEMQQPQRR